MQFKIHSEGKVYVIIFSILTIIFFPFFPIIGFFLAIITLYIFYFFRDPKRTIPTSDLVLSPADGIITSISEIMAPRECNIDNKFIKISIFLSIFNVHVNRIPTYGKVKNITYVPGKFINAKMDKSSSDNERNIITIEKNNSDIIVLTQIAGLIARRIHCDLKVNQEILQGEEYHSPHR